MFGQAIPIASPSSRLRLNSSVRECQGRSERVTSNKMHDAFVSQRVRAAHGVSRLSCQTEAS